MPAVTPLGLSFDHVSHGYDIRGEVLPVLDDVSLTIAPGEFVALLGPSGCGKSTLLRLAAGLELPLRGRTEASGQPITGPGPDRILVFQEATLFPWRTVRGNVEAGPEARGELPGKAPRVDEALRLVGLENFGEAFPHQLSGGMAQRAAIARALVNDPRLLLLDEPLGKLDSLTRLNLQKDLIRLWQDRGFTALLVTHDVEEALLLADRVILFSPRPARIIEEVQVARPHPRRRDDPQLIALRSHLLAALGVLEDV
ncbi:ABC transporter ATP-binding protein [Pseudogemmobacter humi]|uniref:Aliphatic sulfonates import ATP-binding protein SsuB n=1 Tax=Pseudogemmobacter humi TaxID=2483812 RepID=A0A3P5WWN6_9RHOB|nr:ABC transporter ATP-binding protein [Pseudogemmobacter humi]VDC19877.1 Aliphatic sulfonates import ATP-binding protein SsuB [Pseudogemmobacter humi]